MAPPTELCRRSECQEVSPKSLSHLCIRREQQNIKSSLPPLASLLPLKAGSEEETQSSIFCVRRHTTECICEPFTLGEEIVCIMTRLRVGSSHSSRPWKLPLLKLPRNSPAYGYCLGTKLFN